jgi:type III restriction enzyme
LSEGQVVDVSPIINDPYQEPRRHWSFVEDTVPTVEDGRRISGYLPPSSSGELTIGGELVPLALVNDIRNRVRTWREQGYPGATTVTRDLLFRWFDEEREPGVRPFFAQQEAIETIVFLTESPADRRVGLEILRTEAYARWCVKMATGSGKTLVMAMAIAWSVLNKAANPRDVNFADAVLVVCPNLTVKERLAGLDPHRPVNEYRTFDLIPPNLTAMLGQGRVLVTNWHALAPETDPKRSVLRRGPESDAAFCRRVLGPALGNKRRVLVINDEAHHAYRHAAPAKRGEEAAEAERATVWIDGLARIHRDREVLRALDFSATPIYGTGSGHQPGSLFEWVVSDFALVDAIESGLVKIPRIPTDDNAGAAVPKYRDLWSHVKASLPRGDKDDPDRGSDLTAYLTQVDGPLKQLSGEWHETFQRWRDAERPVPPVMIIVCSDTRMAEVLERHVGDKGEAGPELQNSADAQRTVRIDSKLLADAEARDESESASDAAERIRRVVATVGKEGEPGAEVRCLISVQMLSEGWDARNVTQILGLRAFTSQLLCEQVVGRGLRRSSYDDLSVPEYVDVYGVPFQLLPFAKATPATKIEPPKTTSVIALRERKELEIRFPRVVAVVSDIGTSLHADRNAVVAIRVDPENDPTVTRVKGIGTSDQQDHEFMWSNYRRQKLLFDVAARVIKGQKGLEPLFPQAVQLVEWVVSHKVYYAKGVDERELDNELYKSQLAERIRDVIRPGPDGDGRLLPVVDEYEPTGSTTTLAFSTAKPVEPTVKSHVKYVVCDSELERGIARELETDERVVSYVKNDHLFCEIPYRFGGRTLRYIPDFLVDLGDRRFMLIEGKGRETGKDSAKESAARRWVAAVNADGSWGTWSHHVVRARAEVPSSIDEALAVYSAV